MKKQKLKILTPEGTAFEGFADAVYVPGAAGRFEILPGHAPIISALCAGEVRVVEGTQEQRFAVRGGVVKVRDNEITVCAETV